MLNSNLLNSQVLGGGSAPSDVDQDLFVFDGYSLHNTTGTIRVRGSNHDDIGSVQFDTFDAPMIDGGGVLGRYFRGKTVTLPLALRSTTAAGLNTLIDDLKKNTRKKEGWLEVKIDGVVRRVKATVTSLKFNREYFHITFVSEVEISFETMDPHWQLKDATSTTYTSKTADFQEEITNTGSVFTEAKYYYIFGTGIVSLDSVVITINGYALTVSETISDNDILIIDGVNKTVTLNGTAKDYTGVFKELEVGSNPIYFTFAGGSTFTVDLTVIYNLRYK